MKWMRINSPGSLLVVKNANEFVDTVLLKALGKATSSNTKERTPYGLLAWLNSVQDKPNQKTLVGVLKHCL